MNTISIFSMCVVCGIVSLVFGSSELIAQPFEIPVYVIGGGGGTSTGGSFALMGTLGQHDAGPTMSGGSFTLTGGFWAAVNDDDGGVLLGDVNQDGVVSLLDVQPFVNLLTSGQFQAEADINQDGEVNLLDVSPFVSVLTGG